jgi:hypothetical protein
MQSGASVEHASLFSSSTPMKIQLCSSFSSSGVALVLATYMANGGFSSTSLYK